jgi:Na+-translocating ferredoxin:NAD+ oxidoreductase RNF subunit RnfB/DNA-binding Lrp family transcriptional regulator
MDVYQRLAQHLDNLPAGFPSTESGVELRILKRLFTPEDAELARHLTLIPEEPRVIARRAGISREDAERRLAKMAEKGLIFCIYPEGGPRRYQAIQFAVGMWEFQVDRLDPEFVRDMEEYWPAFFDPDVWKRAPQMRTVPVNVSIEVPREVMSYEKAEELVRAHDKIAVGPCICRREQKIKGAGCDKPEETCMQFGKIADYYLHRGTSRPIDRQQALDILKQANESGLVLQPSNSREAAFLCCCCGCCCAVLRNIMRHPKPASIVSTPFVLTVNSETCEGCGTCVDRCQTKALRLEADKAVMNPDRCIGCGLCVSTCPTDSLALARRPESEQAEVPRDFQQTLIKLAKNRGKLSTAGMAKMLVKSKADRFMAGK